MTWLDRRGFLRGAAMTWWPGGNARRPMGPQAREAMRPDRRVLGTQRAGVGPAPSQNIFIGNLVIVHGTGPTSGVFIYNGAPKLGNPPQIAIVPTGVTQDPYGNAITSSKILMQGNTITESGGVFRTSASAPLINMDGIHNALLVYDASSVLRETIAPVATNDGFGTAIPAGFTAYATGLLATLQAANLSWSGPGITAPPVIGSGSTAFLTLASGQTATLTTEAILSLNSVASGAPLAQFNGNLDLNVAGSGLQVAEGANAKQGTAVLAGGTVTVANTSVTANSRIFLTCQIPGGVPGFLRISARTAGTSFTILSSSNTDTSTVAFEIFEPG